MSTRSRMLIALASLLLAGTFLFPLWGVYLKAPQYPEGLGMHIRLSTVTGVKPNDLESINNLNHYIGMKRIEAEAIPELRFMPFVVGGLVVFGFVAAWLGRRWLGRAWVAMLLIGALTGLADFWRWEYEYGHDLDVENAIIKVPGMNYQPPLIGTRKLLNFTATSLPAAGGLLAMVSVALGVFALASDRGRRTTQSAVVGVVFPSAIPS